MAEGEIARFRQAVWRCYKKFGRHDLPWRRTRDPYKILVSEVMLQQTQVARVIPFYKKFIKEFPAAKKLAAAPLSEVLKSWQGLGYNRRAKLLREAAQNLVNTPPFFTRSNLVKELEELPGVGPYTARAVAAFAFNQDVVMVETNIRTAVTHHFFSDGRHQVLARKIGDKEIVEMLVQALPKGWAREWYYALMDYGAYLKKSGVKVNACHSAYVKQKKFAGSVREARGAILRALASGEKYQGETLIRLLGFARRAQMRAALKTLQSEGLIKKTGKHYALQD